MEPENPAAGKVRGLCWTLALAAAAALVVLEAGASPEDVASLAALPALVLGVLALAFYVKGRRDGKAIRKLKEGGAWAHWTYDPFTWNQWAGITFARSRKWLRRMKPAVRFALFGLPPAGAATGLGIAAYNDLRLKGRPDWTSLLIAAAIAVGAVSIPLLVLVAAPRLRRRRMLTSAPEIWLGPDGVYQFGRYISWNRTGSRLTAVELREGPPFELVFRYSSSLGDGPVLTEECVLVPPGREAEGRALRTRFQTR